jgi:hypothetical protein
VLPASAPPEEDAASTAPSLPVDASATPPLEPPLLEPAPLELLLEPAPLELLLEPAPLELLLEPAPLELLLVALSSSPPSSLVGVLLPLLLLPQPAIAAARASAPALAIQRSCDLVTLRMRPSRWVKNAAP